MKTISEDKSYYIKLGKMYVNFQYDQYRDEVLIITLKKDHTEATPYQRPTLDIKRRAEELGGKVVKIMTTVFEEEVE